MMGKHVQIALCLDKMCLEARTGNQMTLVVSQGGDNGGLKDRVRETFQYLCQYYPSKKRGGEDLELY